SFVTAPTSRATNVPNGCYGVTASGTQIHPPPLHSSSRRRDLPFPRRRFAKQDPSHKVCRTLPGTLGKCKNPCKHCFGTLVRLNSRSAGGEKPAGAVPSPFVKAGTRPPEGRKVRQAGSGLSW